MRRLILTGLVLCGAEQVAHAQYSNCQAPQPGCQVPQYCYPRRGAPPTPHQPESAPEEEGAFVGGPESAETAGESNSMGLRFGTLRIPEVTIPFPTLQLPSLVRFRHDAERITGPTHLPYVERGVPEYSLRPERPEESAPEPTPETAPEPEGAPEIDRPYQHCTPPGYYPPCVPGACTSNDPNKRMQQLRQQIAQLNAAVIQLEATQGRAATHGHTGTAGDPHAVSPMTPAAAIHPGASAATSDRLPAVTVEDLARLEAQFTRQLKAQQTEYQANYEQKCQELQALKAQLGETQAQYLYVLESRAADVRQQRDGRLRQELQPQPLSVQADSVAVPEPSNVVEPAPLPVNTPAREQRLAPQPPNAQSATRAAAGATVASEVIQASDSPASKRPTSADDQVKLPSRKQPRLLQRLLRRGK